MGRHEIQDPHHYRSIISQANSINLLKCLDDDTWSILEETR